MLDSMVNRIPLRGAVTIGAAMELEECNVYGPALAEAHYLEDEVADYPRVLVSDSVRRFLAKGQTYSLEPHINKMMQSLAGASRSLLGQGLDDQWIVDYVGKGMHNLFVQDKDYGADVRKAYDFAVQEERRFTAEGDAKLAPRYKQLREYLESRLSIWGIDSSSV